MIDLLQLQRDVFGLLLSAPALNTVNIVMERSFLSDSQVQLDALWTTVRNAHSGNGILIGEPTTNVHSPNLRGAPETILLPITSVQNGDAAFTPETGAGFSAEILDQWVKDILHLQVIAGVGTLQAGATAPDPDFDFIHSRRRQFLITISTANQTARCAAPIATIDTGECTLASTTEDAEIFYTLDGSTPMSPELRDPVTNNVINPQAVLYTGPFAVTEGQTLRAIAQKFGNNASEIINQTIA